MLRVLSGALSHAYVVNLQSPWLAKVRARGYVGFPIDFMIANRAWFASRGYTGIRTFAIRPMGAIQRGDDVSSILNRESWSLAAWLVLTRQTHKLRGSDFSSMWMRHRFTRRICEDRCTMYNLYTFLEHASRGLVVALLGSIGGAFWLQFRCRYRR